MRRGSLRCLSTTLLPTLFYHQNWGSNTPKQAPGAEFCCKTWLREQEAVVQHPLSGQPLVFGGSGSHVTRINWYAVEPA